MRVLGINGSHRASMSTAKYLKYAMDELGKQGFDCETVELAKVKIDYCAACDVCGEKGKCTIDDDTQEICARMREADGIIVASPVYFGSVTGKLKALMDRTRLLRRENMALSGKVGGAIAVGRLRNGGQEMTISVIHNWMLIHEMLVVSDKGTAHFGGTVFSAEDDDEFGKTTCINLAAKIVETLNRLK